MIKMIFAVAIHQKMHVLLQKQNINFLSLGLLLLTAPIAYGDWILSIIWNAGDESILVENYFTVILIQGLYTQS